MDKHGAMGAIRWQLGVLTSLKFYFALLVGLDIIVCSQYGAK